MSTPVPELHRRAVHAFARRLHRVGDDQWDRATPCDQWDVRELVNHVTAENLWTPPLLDGHTIDDVGDRYDGDVLGDDPVTVFDAAAASATDAAANLDSLDRVVHLSFGEASARDYLSQLFADHLVHAWDLAVAVEGDRRLDPELVEACAAWFEGVEEDYRAAGAIGPRVEVGPDADRQTELLARFGRSEGEL